MKKRYTAFASYMLRNSFGATLLVLACAINAIAAGNPHMLPIPLEERIQQSGLIVEGEVVSKKSFWDARRENIYTSNIIKVYKIFKGELKAQELELITEGGNVGLDVHVFSTSLKLTPGRQGIFFLNDQNVLANTPAAGKRSTKAYGSQQGLISYDIHHNKATDAFLQFSSIESAYSAITANTKISYRILRQNEKLEQAINVKNQKQSSQLAPAITSFSPAVTSAGTGTVLTINGSGFGNTRGDGSVEFKNADDGGETYTKPYPREYISWSNTQIKLYIPSYGQDQGVAGSGVFRVTANDGTSVESPTPITIEFAYSNVSVAGVPVNKNGTFKPTLVDKDGAGGYTIQYAPSMLNNIPAQYGFQRAVTSWICNTQVNWKIGDPLNQETTADDERSVIRFAPDSEVGERVLARTISRYAGFRCDNDTLFFLDEFDMEINSDINWQYGPGGPTNRQYDFETVILHELGHAHQLGHIIRPREAVMHFSVEFDKTYRELSAADIEGGEFVMARSTIPNACDEPPIKPIPASECNIFANIINQESEYQAGGTVEIRWTSTQEDGLDYYAVERSSDGINFTEIGTVDATGDNSDYVFTDTEPLPFRSFYRIKAVYTNNDNRYSTRMTITDPEARNKVILTPNPTDKAGKTNLIFLTESSVTVNYQLLDISGKIVMDESVIFTDAMAAKELNLNNLAGGIYILKWSTRSNSGAIKIMKL